MPNRTNPLSLGFICAANSPRELDADTLRMLAAWSVDNNGKLDVSLAGRQDLPGDVLDALIAIRTVDVRVAVLSRPDLDPEVRANLLNGESRSKVLVQLAGHPETTAETFAVLATHDSVAVPIAVLGNKDVPLATRRIALLTAAAHAKQLNQKQRNTIADLVAADVEYENEYVLGMPLIADEGDYGYAVTPAEIDILELFTRRTTLSAEAVSHLYAGHLRWKLRKMLRAWNSEAHASYNDVELYLAMENLPGDVAVDMFDLVEQIEAILQSKEQTHRRSFYPDRGDVRDQLLAAADPVNRAKFAAASHSTDPAELAALAGDDALGRVALRALVANRHLDGPSTAAALRRLGAYNTTSGRLPESRWDQDDVVETCWRSAPDSLNLWVATPGQRALLVRLLDYTERYIGTSEYEGLVVNAYSKDPTVLEDGDVLDRVPLGVFDRYATGNKDVRGAIAARLAFRLSTTGLPTDLLESLTEGDQGHKLTVIGLIELADRLTS